MFRWQEHRACDLTDVVGLDLDASGEDVFEVTNPIEDTICDKVSFASTFMDCDDAGKESMIPHKYSDVKCE